MSLVTGQPRSADVVALTDAVLWVLDEADFRVITAGSTPLLQALTRTLAGRMAENSALLDHLLGRPGPAPDGTAPGAGATPEGASGAPGGAAGAAGGSSEARGEARGGGSGTSGAGGGEAGEPRPSPLTPREREVAVLIAHGLTNREIAAGLVVTERTAATHIEHILNKLSLRSRAQVAVWAAEQGLLDRPGGPGGPGGPSSPRGPSGPNSPPPAGPDAPSPPPQGAGGP
jgi:DNA-binding CsgD family transcriptional regulator